MIFLFLLCLANAHFKTFLAAQSILAVILGGIYTRSLSMAKLAKMTLLTLREFMNKTYDFANIEDTLQLLINSQGTDDKRAR